MSPTELHTVSMAALTAHFETCPYRCNTNHIKCTLGWDLVAVEEKAWFAARKEVLGTNRRYGVAS